jgi:hypothetical protein
MLYYFKAWVPTFLYINYNFNFYFRIVKQSMHQLQSMCIGYPTIYDMSMLALVSCLNIFIAWKYPVYPDSILNTFVSRITVINCCTIYRRVVFLSLWHFCKPTADIVLRGAASRA